MAAHWIVYCPHCNTATTEAIPPRMAGFRKKVQCCLCNRQINAERGSFIFGYPNKKKPKSFDLLEVL